MDKTINFILQRAATIPPLKPPVTLRRVRKWGDPVMLQYGFDVNKVEWEGLGITNFQAVKCFNKLTGFGAVTNYLYIPNAEVLKLRAMQPADPKYTRNQKMNWLCSYRGSLFMYDSIADDWETAPRIRWGTLTLGGNLVQVERYETIRTQFGTEFEEKTIRDVPMARLVGFRKSDWARPLNDLLEEGLVHRCYCVYKDNQFGDSPKGIAYSPFFDPKDYDFAGKEQPDALHIPTVWLEDEP